MTDPDRPRSLALPWNLDLFPTTACTVVAAAGLTVGWHVFHKDVSAFTLDTRAMAKDPLFLIREPWRYFGATLLHAGWIHLLFNLMWMVDFGKLIEGRYGSLRTLGIFALLALGSAGAQVGLHGPGVGLSGVLYGCFGFLWVMSRHDVLELHGCLSRNTEQIMVGWFFLCILLSLTGMLAIGNVAHGYGALVGWLLGMAVVSGARRRWMWWNLLAATTLFGVLASTVCYPWLNWYVWLAWLTKQA